VEWLAETCLQGVDWREPGFLANLCALAEAAKVPTPVPGRPLLTLVALPAACWSSTPRLCGAVPHHRG